MTQHSDPVRVEREPAEGLSIVDVALFLRRHSARIAVWVVLGCVAAGGLLLLARAIIPNVEIASQTIRFTFDGCDRGEYPNGMPFSPKDLLAAPVLERVRESVTMPSSMTAADFAARVTVYQSSRELELLEMEYQQKLGNAKLSQPERDALEREYRSKIESRRNKMFTVVFDATGLQLPKTTCEQVVAKIPEAWASFVQATKGVKAYDFPMVTAVAISTADGDDYLVQAELLRSASQRLASSARQLQSLPGGNLVRDRSGTSLADLRDEIGANDRIHVIPVYVEFLRLAHAQDPARVREVFENRTANQERVVALARARADSIAKAFQAYLAMNSGAAVQPATTPAPAPVGASSLGMGNQMPAIMSLSESFFDKVIAQGIQSKDVEYRQKLNERQIEAALAVLQDQESLEFDKWVLARLDEFPKSQPLDREMVKKSAGRTAASLQAFAKRLTELHALLSERNLNAASQLYRNEDPILIGSQSAVTLSRAAGILGGSAAVAFLLGVLSGLSADRRRSVGV